MQQYWTSFAATGDSNGEKLMQWPKFDAAGHACMDCTDAGLVAKVLRREACDSHIENEKPQAKSAFVKRNWFERKRSLPCADY